MPAIRTTPTVRILILVNAALFLLVLISETFFGVGLVGWFALVPAQIMRSGAVWQFFTYMFLHADLFHILFNMLILWMIGSELEAIWGRRFFLTYYLVCGLSGGFVYFAVQLLTRGALGHTPMLGSSGAVYGLLVAYGILFAERTMLFMMLFPMKAKHFVLVLAGVELVSTVFYSRSGVANAAHLGGMIVGFLFLASVTWWRVERKRRNGEHRRMRRIKNKHLKLVVNNKKVSLQEFEDDAERGPQGPTYH